VEVEGQQEQPTGQVQPPPLRRSRRGYRSLFWPIVLLGVGVVALLFNLDVIAPASLGMLAYVWPFIIIGVAVDLIVGRRSLVAGALVGVVTVGVIIALMLIGPAVGWIGDADIQTAQVDVPVDGATSAQVTIGTSGYSADIHALANPSSSQADSARPLLAGTVEYRGAIRTDQEGSSRRTVTLSAEDQQWWWQWLGESKVGAWDLGLDPTVPLDLIVSSSSGKVRLDLAGIQLTSLQAAMSSGDLDASLPALGGVSYAAALNVSSGDMDVKAEPGARIVMSLTMSSGDLGVTLGADSDVTIDFNGSSGQFTIALAQGQALRVEVRSISSGDVKVPAGLVRVSGSEGKEGAWETTRYAAAAHKVVVVVEHMSSGSVRVNQSE
jgi:hypothetical protein